MKDSSFSKGPLGSFVKGVGSVENGNVMGQMGFDVKGMKILYLVNL